MLKEFTTPIPPFPALLTHNHPPSDIETRSIQEALSRVYVEISKIDVELARLQFVKEELEQFRNQHEGAVSSLRRIPNEIICEFMEHYRTSHICEEPTQAQRSTMVLASVCSRWRAAALSTPQLWTTVVYSHSDHCLPLTQLMLSRSGDCKIELYLRGHIGYLPGNHYDQPSISAINSSAYRLGRISSEKYSLRMPLLGLRPPFGQLHTIKLLFDMNESEIFHIFQNCPVLEDAEIKMRATLPGGLNKALLHIMPQLLRLHVIYRTDPSAFFEHITTPNLTDLCTTLVGMDRWPLPGITDLLHRSQCSLTKLGLAFTDEGSDQAELLHMFNFIPYLEELTIDEHGWTDGAIYNQLTVRIAHPTQLPDLKTLVVRHDAKKMHAESIHAMLVSRSAGCPISKVVLRFPKELPSFRTQEFRSLSADAKLLGYTLEVRVRDERELVVRSS